MKKNYNKEDPFEQVNTYGCNEKTVRGSQNRVSKRRKTESALRITRDCESIVNYQLHPSNPEGNGLQKKKYDDLMGLAI